MNTPKKSNGFTLLEITLVLGAISAITAGSLYVAKRTRSNENTQKAIQTARTLAIILDQSWGKSGSFAGINALDVAQQAPQFPRAKNGALIDSWGGSINFTAPPDGTTYAMTFNAVPADACTDMSMQLTGQFASVAVNNTALPSMLVKRLDPVIASKLCGASDKNTVTLSSFPVSSPTSGEVPLPADHGSAFRSPPQPVPLSLRSVSSVSSATSLYPTVLGLPHSLPTPIASSARANAAPVPQTTYTGQDPSTVTMGFPPQTCFPSSTSTPVVSTVYNTQTLACQPGYVGAIGQQQSALRTVTTTNTVTCATPWSAPKTATTTTTNTGAYGAWTTVSNTCAPMCSTQLSSYPTQSNSRWQTVNQGCPSGYTGTKSYQVLQVQTRSASCASPNSASVPVYGAWSGWSNTGTTRNAVDTCTPAVTAPPVPRVAFSWWGVNVDVSPSPTATSYQMGISCGASMPSAPVASTVQTVANSGLPVASNNAFDTFKPALVIGGLQSVKVGTAQIAAMTQALPMAACSNGLGTWPVHVQVRACIGSTCSAWSAPAPQYCSFNKC